MAEKKQSIAGWLLRPANPVKEAQPVTDAIKASYGRVRAVASGILTPARPDQRLEGISDARVRFAEACQNKRVFERDMPALEKASSVRFYVTAALALLLTVYAILAPRIGGIGFTGFPVVDHGLPWMFALAVWMRAGLYSLYLYQVRARALVDWRTWLRDPAGVFGAPPPRSMITGVLLMLGLFAAGPALAQSSVTGAASSAIGVLSATAERTDLSMMWLQRLFPALADIANGEATNADPLQPMLQLFNSILLLIGIGLLMWHTLMATVYAAHTGGSLGRGGKYHTLWSPVRILMGITLLAPIKGYCMAQIIVLKVIVLGYTIANGMWGVYYEKMLGADMVTQITSPEATSGMDIALRVLEGETCAATVNAYYANSGGVRPQTMGMRRSGARLPDPQGQVVGTGAGEERLWDYGQVCGTIRLSLYAGVSVAASDRERLLTYNFNKDKITAIGTVINSARSSGVPNAIAATVMADPNVTTPPDLPAIFSPALNSWARTYNTSIQSAGGTYVSELNSEATNQFRNTARNLGWAGAGAINFTLTRMAAAATGVIQAGVGGTPPMIPNFRSPFTNQLSSAMNTIRKAQSDAQAAEASTAAGVRMPQDNMDRSVIGKFLAEWSQNMTVRMVNMTKLDTVRPMASIQNVGSASLGAAEAMLAIWIASNVTVNGGGDALAAVTFGVSRVFTGIPEAALKAAAPFVIPLIIGLLIFGVLHAYILPIIPFIIWFYAMMSVVALAAELVIAAPLAALLHIKADGEELLEHKVQNMYIMVFNALLRPSLLLFGLVVASAMIGIMVGYLNRTVGFAVAASMGDSVIGVFGMIAFMIMVFYLHYQICIRSFGLITQVPQMVSQLLGVPDQARGEDNEHNMVAGAIINVTRSGVSQGASAGMRAIGGTKEPDPGSAVPDPTKNSGGTNREPNGGGNTTGGSDTEESKGGTK